MATRTITLNGMAGLELIGQPDECPWCHNSITPNYMGARQALNRSIEVFYSCPDQNCERGFIGYFNFNEYNRTWSYTGNTTQGNIRDRIFSETISKISSSFVVIYNEAFVAEQQYLMEICGVGYRKALEFLIKDYAIKNHPEDQTAIEKKLLGPCIEDYVDNTKIKSVAKRAAWLGNDETHYIRKWEGKNLDDLKRLIDLTTHWIEMEDLTNKIIIDMPE